MAAVVAYYVPKFNAFTTDLDSLLENTSVVDITDVYVFIKIQYKTACDTLAENYDEVDDTKMYSDENGELNKLNTMNEGTYITLCKNMKMYGQMNNICIPNLVVHRLRQKIGRSMDLGMLLETACEKYLNMDTTYADGKEKQDNTKFLIEEIKKDFDVDVVLK